MDADPFPFIFDLRRVPQAEMEVAHSVSYSLRGIQLYVSEFAAALEIFDFARDRMMGTLNRQHLGVTEVLRGNEALQRLASWGRIAARDGALSIYHIGQFLTGISGTLGRSPTLKEHANKAALKIVIRKFKGKFPNREAIRHGIAHAGDVNTPKQLDIHSSADKITLPGISIPAGVKRTFNNNISERHFTATHEGKLFSYEISEATMIFLKQIRTEAIDCFRAFDWSRDLPPGVLDLLRR